MIPKEIRRFYRIIQVFLQHGIDELIPRSRATLPLRILRRGFFWLKNHHRQEPLSVRIRLALEQLGPVWIKFGQMLSTRPDLLPAEVTHQLALLQDAVPPFNGKQAKHEIESALGGPLENWFDNFDENPLASASIAQVHTATLREKTKEIVIKVIRPDILPIIQADITLIRGLATFAEKFLPNMRRFRPIAVVAEYEKTLMDELNLLHEAANAIQLRRNFEQSDLLYIPEVYPDYCKRSVMVMERIYGIPVSDINLLKKQGVNLQLLAERGVQVFFTQVFRDSFFHADMHPGNVFVSYLHPETPQYIAIDCGIVGTLNKEDKRYLAENFIAFFNRNYRKVAELHVDSGWVPADTCVEDFESAIRTLCEPVFQKPLAEISFGHLLINLFTTARRFNMEVQPQLVLLQKTLLYVEGLGRQLYPQLDLWKTAKPFLEKWIKKQTGIRALIHRVKNNAPHWVEQLPDLPDLFYDSLRQQRALRHSLETLTTTLNSQNKHRCHAHYLFGLGCILFLSGVATLLIRNNWNMIAIISMITSIILWIWGWRKII